MGEATAATVAPPARLWRRCGGPGRAGPGGGVAAAGRAAPRRSAAAASLRPVGPVGPGRRRRRYRRRGGRHAWQPGGHGPLRRSKHPCLPSTISESARSRRAGHAAACAHAGGAGDSLRASAQAGPARRHRRACPRGGQVCARPARDPRGTRTGRTPRARCQRAGPARARLSDLRAGRARAGRGPRGSRTGRPPWAPRARCPRAVSA